MFLLLFFYHPLFFVCFQSCGIMIQISTSWQLMPLLLGVANDIAPLHSLNISLCCLLQDYDKFFENFGKHLKLGCIEDRENHKRIAPLLRFFSSQSEDVMISLDEYLENMKPEQKGIYYIASDSVESASNTPFLEKLLEKDLEVCIASQII